MKKLKNGRLIPWVTRCKKCGSLFETPEEWDLHVDTCEACLRK